MGILFLVGQGLLKEDDLQQMLNPNELSAKPVYNMADEMPLILFKCGYDDLSFENTIEGISQLCSNIQVLINYRILHLKN